MHVGVGAGGSVPAQHIGVSRSENLLEKRDAVKPGGDAGLSPRLVGMFRKRAAIFPQPSFRDGPFLCPAFAIITGVLKHFFTGTEPRSTGA